MISRFSISLLALALLAAGGCRPDASRPMAKSLPPAAVAKPVHENDLATITLVPKAEQRLGIRIARVARREVQRRRTLAGEVAYPPGGAITVSSPLSGTLAAPEGGGVPLPGSEVERGQPVFSLLPLLPPEHSVLSVAQQAQLAESKAALSTSQIEARRQVQSAEVEVEAARIALARAEQLVRDRAGTQQAVDEARATLQLAQKALDAARARSAFLEKARLEADAGNLVHQIITAPVSGVLSNLSAVAGEPVVAGQTLFEVVNTRRMWIRVPIYVGRWREVDTSREVTLKEYGEPAEAPGRPARPISAPPSANPTAATVDLFYEVANDDGQLRAGQKVTVTLPLKGRDESLVIPWAAVLFDIHGGNWVYQKVAPQTFVRRRVVVQFVSGSEAVLAEGPDPGTEVVTDGAAELFGTEFGFGK